MFLALCAQLGVIAVWTPDSAFYMYDEGKLVAATHASRDGEHGNDGGTPCRRKFPLDAHRAD